MADRVEGPNTSGIPVSADQLPTGTVYHEPGEQTLRVSIVAGETPVGFPIERSKPGKPLRKRRLHVSVRGGSTPSDPLPGHGKIVIRKHRLTVDEITKGMRRNATRDREPALINGIIDGLLQRIRR